MAAKRRRVKTGCITCRRRRVKCDERKPVCQRCEGANISCDGYQVPRHINSPPGRKVQNRSTEASVIARAPLDIASRYPKTESPLIAYPQNPAPSQRPHLRARWILGHQQYLSRTSQLLFRHDHLYFWREHLLGLAWDTECVFDVVVSLGLMHRAVIMLSSPEDKWRGLDNKVVAFQTYASALEKLSEKFTEANGQPSEMLIASLLLLTWFEVRALSRPLTRRPLVLNQSSVLPVITLLQFDTFV